MYDTNNIKLKGEKGDTGFLRYSLLYNQGPQVQAAEQQQEADPPI